MTQTDTEGKDEKTKNKNNKESKHHFDHKSIIGLNPGNCL